MNWFKKNIIGIIMILVSAGGIFLVVNSTILFYGKYHTKHIDTIESAPVAIVLGAAVLRDKTMSPVLADRAQTALELYQSEKVSKILVSGASKTVENDEVSPVRRFLVSAGVPSEDIFLDHAGFSTYDSMYRAKHIFEIDHAIIVTQQFHLPRALIIAKLLGINVQGVSADRRTYLRKNYRREWLARPYAVWQLIIHRSAEKMGERIPLNQDGRITW
jgi:SanA protein